MPDPALELYLQLEYPWGPEHEQLYKCVTTIAPDQGKGRFVLNHAAQRYDDVIRLIERRRSWPGADVYMATGTYRMANPDPTNDGFAKLTRKKPNVVSLNSLFADVDVDPAKKEAYPTTADAEIGLKNFLKDSGMPDPSMVVRSGSGGFHVYWCVDVPMSVAAWEPLAVALKACAAKHGFKIDAKCTADAARVLRLPSTFNYKTGTAVPVTLDRPTRMELRYTVGDLTKVLSSFMGAQRASTGTGPTVAGVAMGSAWQQNFTANVNEQSMPKLPIDQIAVNCPATAATLIDGGAGHSEPEWSQFIFLSAWTDDPVAAAHRLSQGHKDYQPADTDKKLAEKQQAIASGNLGWPKCASFGHPACKTCVLLQYNKSPIHFAHQKTAQPIGQPLANDLLMPEGYWRDSATNHVFTDGQYMPVNVLGYPILDGGMGYSPDGLQVLVVKSIVSGRERWGQVSLAKQTPQGICEAWTKGVDIMIRGDAKQQTVAKDFTMAWVQHLQRQKLDVPVSSFGWNGDKFVFGDEVFTPAGRESVNRVGKTDYTYRRVGDDKPWHAAMQLIYGRPKLEAIVATAFAAPLIKMVCDSSPVMSIFSHGSGFGKSTAMKLAQAVYAHPIEGMSMLTDTQNAVQNKITTLRNLPVYWDELKTKEDVDKMVTLVFATTQGRGKARLNRDATPMAIGVATTMLIVATNHGILNAVVRATVGTIAGGVRVFELEADPLVSSLPSSQGDYLTMALGDNHGVVGSIYVDFIVRHKQAIDAYIKGLRQELQASCRFSIEERFREATIAAILAGATLANRAGLTTFDVPAIERCLMATLAAMRSNATAKLYAMTSGEELLTDLLNDLRGQLEMITTDTVPLPVMGRPPASQPVTVKNIDPQRMKNVWLQSGDQDGRILMRVMPFDQWCAKRNHNPQRMLDLLRLDFNVVQRKATIGVGVGWLPRTRSECYDLTPKVPPAPPAGPSHNPSGPSSNFGSP